MKPREREREREREASLVLVTIIHEEQGRESSCEREARFA
jgi:hypothetical protein